MKKKFGIGVMLAVISLIAVSGAQAQESKTNDDRKKQCRTNLHGTVWNYDGGGFACNAGSVEASIFCTSKGECVCFGKDCDKIGGNGALGKIGDSKAKILANLSQKLTERDKVRLENLIVKSLSALRDGDGITSVQIIKQIKALSRQIGGGIGGPLEDCGDHCQHLLDEGKAAEYAICYWACVLWGGPSRGSGLITRQVFTKPIRN